jgi:hypothetical protein
MGKIFEFVKGASLALLGCLTLIVMLVASCGGGFGAGYATTQITEAIGIDGVAATAASFTVGLIVGFSALLAAFYLFVLGEEQQGQQPAAATSQPRKQRSVRAIAASVALGAAAFLAATVIGALAAGLIAHLGDTMGMDWSGFATLGGCVAFVVALILLGAKSQKRESTSNAAAGSSTTSQLTSSPRLPRQDATRENDVRRPQEPRQLTYEELVTAADHVVRCAGYDNVHAAYLDFVQQVGGPISAAHMLREAYNNLRARALLEKDFLRGQALHEIVRAANQMLRELGVLKD